MFIVKNFYISNQAVDSAVDVCQQRAPTFDIDILGGESEESSEEEQENNVAFPPPYPPPPTQVNN